MADGDHFELWLKKTSARSFARVMGANVYAYTLMKTNPLQNLPLHSTFTKLPEKTQLSTPLCSTGMGADKETD